MHMKSVIICCIAAVLLGNAASVYPGNMSFSLVSHDLDGVLVRQYHGGIMPSIFLNDSFRFSVLVSYTQHGRHWMIDASAHAAYYPLEGDFWVGMTFLQNILIFGDEQLEDPHLWMHEISLGYDVHLGSRLFITPCLVFRDPFKRYQEEAEKLQELFPSWGTLELGIHISLILFSGG